MAGEGAKAPDHIEVWVGFAVFRDRHVADLELLHDQAVMEGLHLALCLEPGQLTLVPSLVEDGALPVDTGAPFESREYGEGDLDPDPLGCGCLTPKKT